MRYTLLSILLVLLLGAVAQADMLVNWELGFEVDVPSSWLRQEGGASGLKLASDDVKITIEPYAGLTLAAEIERLRQQTKQDGYEFKNEKSYPIHEVPAHEMVFYKDGKYLIFYVLLSGSRGFLISLQSEGTESTAFGEAQTVIANFRVTPVR